MKNIRRERYLTKIKPFVGKNLIKIISGQRRVGKSFLLKQIRDEIKKENPDVNIIQIDYEKFEFRNLKTAESLYDYIKRKAIKDKMNSVFIDEIQEVREFEKVLRNFYSKDNFDIYCSGSNAQLLSGEFATMLSGRQIEIKVHPLSYIEYLKFRDLESTSQNLNAYIEEGGMPYLINLPKEKEIVDEYLQNILNTIFFRDIVTRYKIRDTEFLQNLVSFIADNVGSLTSATKISKYLKSENINKTAQVVIDYLRCVQNSFLINKIKRYDIQGKKIFESGEKYFFEDIGLRNVIAGFKLTDMNKILENVVFNHLVFCDFKVYVGKLNNLEVDFVAVKGSEKLYVQATYKINDEKTAAREFGNLLKIKDNYPKILITTDEIEFTSSYEGIKHYTLRKFLETMF